MLPGFNFVEDPVIYAFSVADVANQVACELQAFARDQQLRQQNRRLSDPNRYKWVLDEGDVSVKLQLQKDHQGYVSFTGINLAKAGFDSLAKLIAAQSNVPSLGAKLSAKRQRTVEVDFTISPRPFTRDQAKNVYDCTSLSLSNNPFTQLYLQEWLYNYFEN